MIDDRVVVPLRALEHHGYCPRQAALIHGDGVWADNVHILRGERGHARVDRAPSRRERGRRVLRRVDVWSERLGVRGRCDVVEVHDDGRLVPVEYKMGVRHGIAADLQVCGQALCLEEMLDVRIDEAAIWYGQPRRRHTVGLDEALRAATEQAVLDIRRAMSDRHLPAAPDDARCTECQLLTHCAPSIVADPDRVLRYMREQVMMCD